MHRVARSTRPLDEHRRGADVDPATGLSAAPL